jgi:NAD(P)-dependent dehydrogenase (short-subunit alcohol dehydrogenase family)
MKTHITLEGRVAIVSGGGAGIGHATAEAFADLGAKVVIAEIDARKIGPLQSHFKARGANVVVIQTDVCKLDQVSALIRQVDERFGRLDVLVNNVGHHLGIIKTIENTSEDDFDALYRINLYHMFLMVRTALPLMRRSGDGGSIINLSSVEGFRGCPSNVAYTTFKHAVTGFTRSLAIELSKDKIRVNTIAPDTSDSEQVPLSAIIRPGMLEIAERTVPLGRLGRASDSAGAAVFLATDLSAWVTGTTIHVDGGTLVAGGFQRLPNGAWSIHPVVTDSTHPPFGAPDSSEVLANALRGP